jgi:hypothetical protein
MNLTADLLELASSAPASDLGPCVGDDNISTVTPEVSGLPDFGDFSLDDESWATT